MKLPALISSIDQLKNISRDLPAVEITGIQFDSREVQPGDLFVAQEGASFDGHAYIDVAIRNGAVAVMGNKPQDLDSVPYLRVENTREALAYVSAAFYGFPARRLTMIGVTGTDGKTTTVNLIYSILLTCGIRAGMISTVNAVIGNEEIDTGFHVTTPDAPMIQKILRRMVDNDITHVVLETTSHGLAQHRAASCDFDIGVITNITHEHLDYHGDYQSYLNAKARLLIGLAETPEKDGKAIRMAVLNRDDVSYPYLSTILSAPEYQTVRRITYGMNSACDVCGCDLQSLSEGIGFQLDVKGRTWPVRSELTGDYNIYNIMAAVTVASYGLDLDMPSILEGVRKMEGVPGRMQKIDKGQDFLAIVDFAHTPNALKVALETVNHMKGSGRVIAVFGSAGLRDRQKRRMMAATSIGLADVTILTAEDPRTESLEDILDEMSDEAQKSGGVEGKTYLCVPDRGQAIQTAVDMAEPGDIVIACGKGHEQSMCFGRTEYHWDDRTAMRAALAKRLGVPGSEMPYLPTQDAEDQEK